MHLMYSWLWHLWAYCSAVAELALWHAPSYVLLRPSPSPGVGRDNWPPFLPGGGNLMQRFPADVAVSCCPGVLI